MIRLTDTDREIGASSAWNHAQDAERHRFGVYPPAPPRPYGVSCVACQRTRDDVRTEPHCYACTEAALSDGERWNRTWTRGIGRCLYRTPGCAHATGQHHRCEVAA